MEFTWLDGVIILIFLFYGLEGMSVGFIFALFDFISFVASFVFGLTLYTIFGGFLVQIFSLSSGFAHAIGFFLVATISEIILNIVLQKAFRAYFAKKPLKESFRKANTYLGFLPGAFSAYVLLAFVLTLVMALPLSQFLKDAITQSRLGNVMIVSTQGFEKNLKGVFGGVVTETINFLTIEPQSDEFVALRFKTTNVRVNTQAEDTMLALLNQERTQRGLPALVNDTLLVQVARLHAKDMFARGYFSHNTPEGLSPFDRMATANVIYAAAGENLALAPNVELAMQGLMNSPGHRKNMLSPDFRKVGIGAIDGGIYGIMFSQEFTDVLETRGRLRSMCGKIQNMGA